MVCGLAAPPSTGPASRKTSGHKNATLRARWKVVGIRKCARLSVFVLHRLVRLGRRRMKSARRVVLMGHSYGGVVAAHLYRCRLCHVAFLALDFCCVHHSTRSICKRRCAKMNLSLSQAFACGCLLQTKDAMTTRFETNHLISRHEIKRGILAKRLILVCCQGIAPGLLFQDSFSHAPRFVCWIQALTFLNL